MAQLLVTVPTRVKAREFSSFGVEKSLTVDRTAREKADTAFLHVARFSEEWPSRLTFGSNFQ